MDLLIGDVRNGVTWTRDCLIDGEAMARALDRLQVECGTGIRYFSAIGAAVPLDQARSVENEILRREAELGEGMSQAADDAFLTKERLNAHDFVDARD